MGTVSRIPAQHWNFNEFHVDFVFRFYSVFACIFFFTSIFSLFQYSKSHTRHPILSIQYSKKKKRLYRRKKMQTIKKSFNLSNMWFLSMNLIVFLVVIWFRNSDISMFCWFVNRYPTKCKITIINVLNAIISSFAKKKPCVQVLYYLISIEGEQKNIYNIFATHNVLARYISKNAVRKKKESKCTVHSRTCIQWRCCCRCVYVYEWLHRKCMSFVYCGELVSHQNPKLER